MLLCQDVEVSLEYGEGANDPNQLKWDVGIVEMLADVSEFQFFKDICLLRLGCVQSFTMITVFCLKV